MRLPLSLLCLLALGFTGALRAQSGHWEPPGGTLPVGQVTALQLVFQDCEPKETPAPPKVDGLTLEFTSQATNISWINGDYSRSITYTYAALLAKKAGVDLPAFAVETNKGTVHVPAVHFEPTGATVGSTGQSLEAAANARLEAAPASVWAGEVFNLSYRVDVARSYYPDFGHGDFSWAPGPLAAEDWDKPEPYALTTGGEARTGFIYRTRATARTPGSLPLGAVTQLVNLSVGVSGFGFFQQRQYQQFSVTSNAPTIEVRPLPPAPPGLHRRGGRLQAGLQGRADEHRRGRADHLDDRAHGHGQLARHRRPAGARGFPATSRSSSPRPSARRPRASSSPPRSPRMSSSCRPPPAAIPLEDFHFVYFDPKSGTYQTLTAPADDRDGDRPRRRRRCPRPPAERPARAPLRAGRPKMPRPRPSPTGAPNGLPRDPLAGPGFREPALDRLAPRPPAARSGSR